jgi:diguanylate cyclase (GGDEF)-like protein
MRLPRRYGAFFALVLISAAVVAQGSHGPQAPLRTLVTAQEAHSLTIEEAKRAYPVHLRAVATYYDPNIDPRHGALFVCDPTGCIFIRIPNAALDTTPDLPAGALVDIVGVTAVGDYAPILINPTIRVIGQSHLPEQAQKTTLTHMLSGTLDGQWVEIDGVVRSVRLTAWNAILEIAGNDGSISAVTLRQTGTDYEAMIDSRVRLRGNAAPVFNRKFQMVGARLFFPTLRELTVLEAPPSDPYAMEVLPISSLLLYRPGLDLVRRVHVQGRVTLQWPGRLLCIQQQSEGLCMTTSLPAQVGTGNLVDILGFPAISEFKATLEDIALRPAGGSALQPIAKPITASQIFQGDHDGELVVIEGELIDQDRATGDLTLMLRSGDSRFLAILPKESMAPGQLIWKDGSLLRLTGICSVQIDPDAATLGVASVRPVMVRILLRSRGDVELLRSPSWWTTRNVAGILLAVVAMAFAAFAWIVVLRRRVRQQTQALRESEERLRHLSEHDALTNLPNRILLNDRFSVALQRAERFHEGMGLLMVDVDRFKDVNDTYGHHAGDKVLCELAKRIRHSVRLTDTVARLGGDEFIILLPDLHTRDEAQTIAAKVVASVAAPFNIGNEQSPIHVTVSVGVCTYPEAGLTIENLLRHVDDAMYNVKAHGRNGFQVYQPAEMQSR